VARQIAALYRGEYEALFGPLPALDQFPVLSAADAGCATLPSNAATASCPKPGAEDEQVTRVVANMGKAISAYTRLLTCGESRFDRWIRGDAAALTAEEQAGALVFVGKGGCDGCHSGPYFTDQKFHNVGVPGGVVPFTGIDTSNDRGAAAGLALVLDDWLGPQGPFSDGDDGRLAHVPEDLTKLEGAFRTPGLRCMENRKSYMHNGEFRTLEDVVELFDAGKGHAGYVGTSEIKPLGLTVEEKAQLVAFMRTLQGPGPDPSLREAPALP
jgi:cytochrome c peroxidase